MALKMITVRFTLDDDEDDEAEHRVGFLAHSIDEAFAMAKRTYRNINNLQLVRCKIL